MDESDNQIDSKVSSKIGRNDERSLLFGTSQVKDVKSVNNEIASCKPALIISGFGLDTSVLPEHDFAVIHIPCSRREVASLRKSLLWNTLFRRTYIMYLMVTSCSELNHSIQDLSLFSRECYIKAFPKCHYPPRSGKGMHCSIRNGIVQ